MVAEVKLAVAGSGKTRWLGENVSPNNRNLLITFTNQNVNNIKRSVISHLGEIPENTCIMTYTRFVYYWLIRPFEPSLKVGTITGGFVSSGIDITQPAEHDRLNPGNGYYKNDNILHYLSRRSSKLFSNRLSDLYCKQSAAYKKNARNTISMFFDEIYVDEFQDFTDSDFKLLIDLAKISGTNVHYVGDYYQSLVSKSNKRKGTPYSNGRDLSAIIGQLEKNMLVVDTTTLMKSWRCSADSCSFINHKLGIPLVSADGHEGKILHVTENQEIYKVLYNPKITKLMWNAAIPGYGIFPSTNKWGYSKGDTYKDICVILTKSTDGIVLNQEFAPTTQTLHMLYVALTRANHDVYLIDSPTYHRFMHDNILQSG